MSVLYSSKIILTNWTSALSVRVKTFIELVQYLWFLKMFKVQINVYEHIESLTENKWIQQK